MPVMVAGAKLRTQKIVMKHIQRGNKGFALLSWSAASAAATICHVVRIDAVAVNDAAGTPAPVQGAHADGLRKRTQVPHSVANSLIPGDGFGHLFRCVRPLKYWRAYYLATVHREQNL
jgi:hypothetical protein